MSKDKALVLGGGGITGIAWEAGVLAGLIDSGIKMNQVDKILGSSAGSFVGAILANNQNMQAYYQDLATHHSESDNAQLDPAIYGLWTKAFIKGRDNEQLIGQHLGDIINSHPSTVSPETRSDSIQQRLGNAKWTNQLEITAINTKTGKLSTFNENSGVSLKEAVTASGAVPGLWPHINLLGESWIDGGMISSTNAMLVSDYQDIIILAPLSQKLGQVPSVYEEAEKLKEQSNVTLIVPDENSKGSIGQNIYSSKNIKEIGDAGYEQGKTLATSLTENIENWK